MIETVSSTVRRRASAIRVAVGKVLGLVVLGWVVTATPSASAADACEMAVCMWGKLTGTNGGSACSSPEKAYFAILVRKKHNKISWSSTAKKRLQTLNSCPNADSSQTKQINDKFGKVRG